VRVQFARLHDRVGDLLTAAGASDLLARSSHSVDDAVEIMEASVQDPGRKS
jgi:hypothetical protein